MAILEYKGQKKEVKDGSKLVKACEEMGMVFGCKEGLCEICRVQVTEGAQDLNELTDNEKEMGIEKPHRLACQCIIKKGHVKFVLDNGL